MDSLKQKIKSMVKAKLTKFLPSYESSFSSMRTKFVPSYDSSFATMRTNKLKEDIGHVHGLEKKQETETNTNRLGTDYDAVHDHPNLKPKGVTPEHKKAITNYTEATNEDQKHGHASSQNMNNYLRNRAGDKSVGVKFQDHKKVHKAVQKFSSCWTPENTNKETTHTYSGIPKHVGEHLQKSGEGSKHVLPGFTSTSTNVETAKGFAEQHSGEGKVHHLLHCHVEPGAGLSVAHHSGYEEHEVVLNHGSHITYHGSTTHKSKGGQKYIVHHVTVHNKQKPVDEYGSYDHPQAKD